MPAIIKPCNCQSEFQDNAYGKGLRVHSEKKEGKEAKCTICGKIEANK